MKVTRLTIANFRGIRDAELFLDGHSLLVGGNNIGKSTICEALDLVLGPERLSRTPPVDEYDFFNGRYLDEAQAPLELRVEVVLIGLGEDTRRICAPHIEFWHGEERRLLDRGEGSKTTLTAVEPCLRLATIGKYDPDEDTFEAQTIFPHSPGKPEGQYDLVSQKFKRTIGFLYLRALRTGARALSLERGSLLDIILRMKELRTGMWEAARKRLQELSPPIDSEMTELRGVLDSIEQRLGEYVHVQKDVQATRIFISQLTREHLRKTLSFFLSVAPKQEPVPFQEVGTGTLSLLVFALLSFIAEAKKDNVIFAMEEPEIALPPHSQRRILKYLLEETAQCIVTSHSPYVIERFESGRTMVLRRDDTGRLTAANLALPAGVKPKTYRNQMRRAIAEAMLGAGVVVGEGITERLVLAEAARILEDADATLFPLDLSGVSIVNTEGEGNLSEMGVFFGVVGLKRFAFFDERKRQDEERKRIDQSFDGVCEVPYKGMEALLAAEVPLDRQWEYLERARAEGMSTSTPIPETRPGHDDIRKLTLNVLRRAKGEGSAADMVGLCTASEIPATIAAFLKQVYAVFPRPVRATMPTVKPASAQDDATDHGSL